MNYKKKLFNLVCEVIRKNSHSEILSEYTELLQSSPINEIGLRELVRKMYKREKIVLNKINIFNKYIISLRYNEDIYHSWIDNCFIEYKTRKIIYRYNYKLSLTKIPKLKKCDADISCEIESQILTKKITPKPDFTKDVITEDSFKTQIHVKGYTGNKVFKEGSILNKEENEWVNNNCSEEVKKEIEKYCILFK